MTDGGSITLTSGTAAYRPAPGGTLAASGVMESAWSARSPSSWRRSGSTRSRPAGSTPRSGPATPEAKQARFADMASRLPARRPGTPADVARAIGYLMDDDFVTGTVLHAEGGQLLV